MKTFMVFASAAALAFSVTTAVAQGKRKAPTQRTTVSIECSKQADAKGLHGKARHAFRSRCKRNAAKGGKG